MYPTDLPKSVLYDLVHSVLGERLGVGMSREVYVYQPDPALVIKLEVGQNFQNTVEWTTWHELGATKHGVYLAPCTWISLCGTAMLMKRTTPMATGAEPKRLPAWLTDTKRTNYGTLDGRVVCHDYGVNLLMNHGAYKSKPRAVKWWDA